MSKLNEKPEVIKHLQTLRNIGPKMAESLYSLGIKTPEQMKRSDPDKLFKRLQVMDPKTDPCELYVFRGAVLDIPWWECKNLVKKISKKKMKRQALRGITMLLKAILSWAAVTIFIAGIMGCGGPRYDKSQKPPDWLLAEEKWETIEINDYKAKYSVSGKGNPIVFIPGLSGTKDKLSAYQKLRERFKCISYNLRGLANDGNKLTDYGIEQLSRDLDALFTKLNLGKAILVGNSYGGTIALQFTLDHPEKVKALILKGAFAKFDFDLKNSILAFGVKHAPDFLYCLSIRKHVEDVVASGEPQWAYDYVLGQDLSVSRETAIQRIESLKKFDLRDKLSEIMAPTLIIVGSQDELTGIKYQLCLGSHIPNSYIKVIKGVGHLVDILRPEEYERVIFNFIRAFR